MGDPSSMPDIFGANGSEQWWNPLTYGERKPQMFDPNSNQAVDARTFEADPSKINHAYDVQGVTSQGTSAGQAQRGQAFTGQAAGLDTGNYNQARTGQMGLARSLTDAMNGRGPSAAGMAAQNQRDAALSQASALQAGRSGQAAAAGIGSANLASQMGVQQANQNEAVGRANEMAQARGELGNVYGQVAGQDIGVAGQNAGFGQQMSMFNAGQQQGMSQFNAGQGNQMAQFNANLGQQNNQFNAQQQQQANLADQAAQLGISTQELQARQQEQLMSYGNLDPGSKGYIGQMGGSGVGSVIGALLAHGGVAVPRFAAGGMAGVPDYSYMGFGAAPSGGPSSTNYQLMGIGQRRVPLSKGDLDQGKTLAQLITGILGGYMQARGRREQEAKDAKAKADSDAKWQSLVKTLNPSADTSQDTPGPVTRPDGGPGPDLSVRYPHASDDTAAPASVPADDAGPTPDWATDAGTDVRGGVPAFGRGVMAYGNGGVEYGLPLGGLAQMLSKDGGGDRSKVVRGPTPALVGEDGPEAVVSLDQIVDRPTLTTLGHRPQAVIPLSADKSDDRDRVTQLALHLKRALGGR